MNIIFIRHSFACHNSLPKLFKNGTIDFKTVREFLPDSLERIASESPIKPLSDPELTEIGVTSATNNGCVVKNILYDKFDIKSIDMVCCSPLLRCLESAYHYSRKWSRPPLKIFVMPFLREIDEGSDDIYSQNSINKIRTTPAYSMKSIREQKDYLQSVGILDFFDFAYVEEFPLGRVDPGNIQDFIDFFGESVFTHQTNVMTFTHAGVMKRFAGEGFTNNCGFVVKVKFDKDGGKVTGYTSLNDVVKNTPFFFDYSKYNTVSYMCPSTRCNNICDHILDQSTTLLRLPNVKCKDLARTSSDIDTSDSSDPDSDMEWDTDDDDVWP